MITASDQVGCRQAAGCVSVLLADTCVNYTPDRVNQLTPVSLDYKEHVHVNVCLCISPCGRQGSRTRLGAEVQTFL